MQTAAVLRNQIEAVLSARHPAALSPRTRPELDRTLCGIASLDVLLQGGLPAGVLTELVGAECSGRTTMAMAYVAAITHAGSVCAWIDVGDTLDPESVAANGIDLERLLWVRCGPNRKGLGAPSLASETWVVRADNPEASTARHTGGGSPHPRSEGRDMPQAISAMLHAHGGLYDKQVRRERRAIGTPGAPNRPLSQRWGQREEQVNSDRMPARRGDNLALTQLTFTPRCAEPQRRRLPFAAPSSSKPWQALDQALRATDLLLQAGGFSAIVLDLGSTPPEAAWRIPLATWFRFRAACERTRVSLLLLTQHPCARSSAELVVRMEPGIMEAHSKVMTGIRYHATTERTRFNTTVERIVSIRKPPQSERPGQRPHQWKSEAAWARMR